MTVRLRYDTIEETLKEQIRFRSYYADNGINFKDKLYICPNYYKLIFILTV